MVFEDSSKPNKNIFSRFWYSENDKISIIRDVFVAFIIVFVILIALWTYTGQWFDAPMVAIESGSMMHNNEPFGRIGTIDAGDMVLLVKVNSKDDISTYVDKDNNNYHYGKYGDVVIYHPDGRSDRDQIIHRAMCWVDVEYIGTEKYYTIEGCGIVNQSADEPLYCKECGIMSMDGNPIKVDWDNSGFITKGDNPNTNPICDQLGGITSQPVKVKWISGKARGELPWIGTINLIFNDMTSWKNTVRNVKGDSIDCLTVLIEFLILLPVGMDINSYYQDRKKLLKQNIEKNKKNNLEFLIFYYWTSAIIFLVIYHFVISTFIGALLHFSMFLLVHLLFLLLVKIEFQIIKLKDFQFWLTLIIFTGPLGLTILYLSNKEKQ